jgi:hypothetical protein
MLSKYDYHHIQLIHYIITYHQHWLDDKIIMLSKYDYHHIQLIYHNHNKITTNVSQMIKLSCSQNMIIIIFNLFIMIHNHNIELILNKTYGHDNLIMLNLSPTLVGR